jgi:thymidylate kinase
MNTQSRLSEAFPNGYSRNETSAAVLRPFPRTKLGRFGSTLCQLLEEQSIRYCLIGASENDSHVPDLAVHPADRDRLRGVFEPLRQEGYVAVECVPFAVESDRFYFACLLEPQTHFVSMNVVYGYRGEGLNWKNTIGLVQRRVRCGDHWGLSAEDEFAYWLGQNSMRGTLEQHQERRLKALVVDLGCEDAEKSAGRVYSEGRKREIVRACADGTISKLTDGWKKGLRRKRLRQQPTSEIAYALKDGWRLVRRWWKPSGLFLALLGPDGVGKSTTTANIKRDLTPLFSQQREFHWRPQLLMPRPEDPRPGDRSGRLQEMFSQNRHGDPPRGFLISTVRLLGVMLDYWIGYFTQIRGRLVRSGLIVFDRYYHDILVDSLRYRYGGSKWFLRALRFALPPWRVFFLILDADEQIVYSRKQELTLSEIQYQRAAYRELSTQLPSALLIRTDTGLEMCRDQALRGIVEHLGRRFRSLSGY